MLLASSSFAQEDGSGPNIMKHISSGNYFNSGTAACADGGNYGQNGGCNVAGCDAGSNPGCQDISMRTNHMCGWGDFNLCGNNHRIGVYANPCLDTGEVWREDTQDCGPPPPPTDAECVAEHGPGWVSSSIDIGGESYNTCALVFPDNNQEECSNPVGTVEYGGETEIICADDRDECSNTGGTWGTWGLAGQETTGCLPPDTTTPTCSSTGAIVFDGVDSFVCESPEPFEDDTPNNETPDPVDTDGDGTPDSNDSDLDGDGIPNSTDPDRDGDGIPNEDDLTPDGESTEEPESTVEGGGGCDVAPRCTGDAIQCSILYQTWKLRCAEDSEEIEPDTDLTELNNQYGTDLVNGDDEDLSTAISGFLTASGAAGSCPADLTFNYAGSSIPVSYQPMCDLATTVRPFIIFLFGFMGFRIVMRSFN